MLQQLSECRWPVMMLTGLLALASAQAESVEKAAKALLQAKCVSCHGATKMSDLDLRESGAILKGGKRGPSVVPGNAAASLLYKAVAREGDLHMPPGKTALSAAEIAVLRDWINAGARLEPSEEVSGTQTW